MTSYLPSELEKSKPEAKNSYLLPEPPLESFPAKIQKLLIEASIAFKRIPIEVPIVALLSLLAACVGRARAVEIKDGWKEHGNLYISIVADSGLGKTPCAKEFFKPLWQQEIMAKAKWDNEMMQFNLALEERKKSKDASGLGPYPQKPIRIQYIIEDTTEEAIALAIQNNPRGLLWACDELSSFVLNLDRYSNASKGGTKARLLSTYDGAAWKINRCDSDKDQIIPSATLSIFGTVQPRILKQLFSQNDAASGFLPRFIFILAKRDTPALLENEIFTGQETLSKIAHNILNWEMTKDGDEWKPKSVKFCKAAYGVYENWHNLIMESAWKGSPIDQAISAKLVAQVARIALLLHSLKTALADEDGLSDISLETVENAIQIGNWIKAHQKLVWIALDIEDSPAKTPLEKAIILTSLSLENWLMEHDWKISNEIFNALVCKEMSQSIDGGHIGRTANKLGIKPISIGKKRGKLFSEKLLKELKIMFYL